MDIHVARGCRTSLARDEEFTRPPRHCFADSDTTGRVEPGSLASMRALDLIDDRWGAEGVQDLRDRYLPALVLEGLKQSDEKAGRHRRAVQRMGRARPRVVSITDTESTGLVIGGVRARGDLAVAPFARHPRFDVVLLRRRGAEITRGGVDHAVSESQSTDDRLLDGEDLLVVVLRLLREGVEVHLHLVELVQAHDPLGVPAGGTRFTSEVRGVPGVAKRHLARLEDLTLVQPGECHLRGA